MWVRCTALRRNTNRRQHSEITPRCLFLQISFGLILTFLRKGSERVEGLTVHTVEMQSLTLFSIGERVQRTYMEIQFFNPILSPFGRLTLLVSGCSGPTRRCTHGRRWSLCAVVTRPGWDSTIWRPPSWRPWVEYRVKRWYIPFKSYTLILSGQRFVDPSTIYGVYRQSVM